MKRTHLASGLAALLRFGGEAGLKPAGTRNATPDTPSRGDHEGEPRGGDTNQLGRLESPDETNANSLSKRLIKSLVAI